MDRDRVRAWVRAVAASWSGRLGLAGVGAKLILLPLPAGVLLIDALDLAASIAIAAACLRPAAAGLLRVRRVLLWRVRRKLILSYVFIGVVPVLLVVAFFLVAAVMSVLSMRSELVRREIDAMVAHARVGTAAIGARLAGGADPAAALERWRAGRPGDASGASGLVLDPAAGEPLATVGPWRHAPPPPRLPAWVPGDGFAGVVTTGPRDAVVARAVIRVERPAPRIVVVDAPLDQAARARIAAATGVVLDPIGRRGSADAGDPARFASVQGLTWALFLEPTNWAAGSPESASLVIRVPVAAFSQQLFGFGVGADDADVRSIFLVLLAGIGGLFLMIELAALVTGLVLARSITGSVHALFTGTNRIRRGDFTRRIRIASGDQLGELAVSFNAMTASIEGLLHQAAEKKRLENELRLARRIQMSLLPRAAASIPGLPMAAVCRPAREVGGDYYDFIRLGERRLGILVADVSGKGTSAALYMAELKGLVLGLGYVYESPRELLLEVNRILAGTLDSRSFITMLYAVIDLDAGTLTYARAGHTPLIYASPANGRTEVQVLAPDGLVLGLRGFERQFDALLEEHRLAIRPGDVAVLFTDGVTEAMNEADDLFGEARIMRVIEDHPDAPAAALHERILHAVDTFVGAADQQDDMTMVLLRVEEVGLEAAPPAGADPARASVEPPA